MSTAKSDAAHEATDRQIAALERRIVKLYTAAEKDLRACITHYFEQFRKNDEQKIKQREAGEITEQEFIQWRLAQIGRGKEFEALRDKVAEDLAGVTNEAIESVAAEMPGVYAINYNQEAEAINTDEGSAIPLIMAAAVVLLWNQKSDTMTRPKLNRQKDIAWNRRNFSASVTSSILMNRPLLGKDSICAASVTMTVEKSRHSARVNARTFLTNAETRGRQAVYTAAEKLGMHREKTWHTVHDNRVRHQHALMDGITVPATEKFGVDGYDMIGPGDTSAPPYLWYNCRCRMTSKRKKKVVNASEEKEVV